jgi:hypothetical protein
MTRRKRRLAVSGALLLTAAVFVARGGPAVQLRVAGTMSSVAVGQDNVPAGQEWSFGAITLCVTAPDTAVVDSVALIEPTDGLRLNAFATRPSPFSTGQRGLGGEPVSLDTYAGGFVVGAQQTVTTVCPKEGEEQTWLGGSELGFQVSKSTDGLARSQGLEVTYEASGSKGTFKIPFGIALCAVGVRCADTPGLGPPPMP